ncbi:hypothetical protein HPB47_008773 [Ixodes persulcatus]|uniref:Uncharacterized protein n=1 Tax=Ixodes persulcatus TaxID=34615 RepID=A0AC60P3U2_IXOPE|nr:hypothetical protein HPB47_008773 [Ixodes persulcatus]
MLEPVPAAVASITPQREDFAPFGLSDAAPCEGDVAPLPAFDAFQEAAASAANDSSNFDPFGNFEDNTSPMETKTDLSVTSTQDTGNAFGEFDLLHREPHKAVTPTKDHDYDPLTRPTSSWNPQRARFPSRHGRI